MEPVLICAALYFTYEMMSGKKNAFVTFSTKQSHCFDKDLLKRFIATLSKSDSFDLSGLL
jgi:hypothetical protein